MLGIPSFALSQAYTLGEQAAAVLGDRDRARARHHPARAQGRASRATCWSTSTFPDCPPGAVKGIAVVDAGQARPGAAAHRRAPRRPRQSVLLDRLCARRAADRQGRHRSRRARRQPHRGDAAAPRSHRPAVPDQARGAVSRQASKDARVPRRRKRTAHGVHADAAPRGISDKAVLRAMDEVPREHFVEAALRRQRLCRPGDADRLRPDHQPALCRRLHDRAARGAAEPPRARGRHRLGLPGGGAVAARPRGGHARALPHARRTARARG